MIHYDQTQHGFEYGAARVERLAHDAKRGWVVVQISSPKGAVQVYATKTGKIMIKGTGAPLTLI